MAYNSVAATFPFPTGSVDASATVNGVVDNKNYSVPTPARVTFGLGTGALKINLISKLYQASLVATTAVIDLTALLDEWGTAINFARVKGIVIYNFATTPGFVLKVGAAGTNPWDGLAVTAASDKFKVPPGYLNGPVVVPGFVMVGAPDAAGLVVGTPKNIQLDSGANTVPYGIQFFGADA